MRSRCLNSVVTRLALVLVASSGALAVPSAATQYVAQRIGDVVQLQDASTQTVVSILPVVGNIVFEMKVNGHDVLRWPYRSVDEFKQKPALSGIPFVGPWANRLDEQAFYANGRRYAFDMTLGNVRGTTPIHGFLSTTDAWRLIEVRADAQAAWATSRLNVDQPAWIRQWPFAHTVEITHRLQHGVLEVRTKITNTSHQAMPVAIGFHPYFQLTDSRRDDWKLSVGARTHWLLNSDKIPTGEVEPVDRLFDRPSITLRDYNLDDVFGDLQRDARGRATMTVVGKSQRLDVDLGPKFRSVVIWAPNSADTGRGSQRLTGAPNPVDRGDFICLEPMAGITDALNLSQKGLYKELQTIAPGGSWEESFWVRPSGF